MVREQYDGVLLSAPARATPSTRASASTLVRALRRRRLPLLGVCLGHQAIAEALRRRRSGRAPELLHGKTSQVHHQGAGVLAGLPDPFTATRYHSLAVEPDDRARRARGHRHAPRAA